MSVRCLQRWCGSRPQPPAIFTIAEIEPRGHCAVATDELCPMRSGETTKTAWTSRSSAMPSKHMTTTVDRSEQRNCVRPQRKSRAPREGTRLISPDDRQRAQGLAGLELRALMIAPAIPPAAIAPNGISKDPSPTTGRVSTSVGLRLRAPLFIMPSQGGEERMLSIA